MHTEQFDLHAELEDRHWWFVARRRILRRLVGEVLPPDDNALVVDVGCGTGANLAALANDYRCVGIDTSADAIERARRRFRHVEFLHGAAPDDLGGRMQQARLVMLTDVLEHVPDDFDLLTRLLAAAAPGTHFLITVPAGLDLWSEHDESFGHYRRYDAERLHRLWVGLPVRTRMISYYNSRLYPLVRMIRRRNRRRGRARGVEGTDFHMPGTLTNRALTRIFAGEARLLCKLLNGRRGLGYRRGVSLIALLQRQPGPIRLRAKPADVPPDPFNPATGEMVLAGV